ncbi:hypothetical protein CMO93_01845 [Candidatus Woesearchaeota archaeon]|nr:hypothetical protein [Candidatus Woesearchaeota archaeon]|tara:strand:+ start:821 stop:1282 length:462 start_codon:yes stop_codon:yes gene_type:complete
MYKGHSNWDEDKWDIHSNKGSYAGHGSDKTKDQVDYHKNEQYSSSNKMYGSSDGDGDKIKDSYRSEQQEEENKEKENEEQEKNIDDAVEQEEQMKKQPEDEEETTFKTLTNEFQHVLDSQEKNKKTQKKKQHKSIEEAIDKAVKEEKETIFVD